jgi:hypothetical protein
VGRLLASWQADYQVFCRRDLTDRDYVYVWADGLVRHEAPSDRAGGRTRLRSVAAGR